LAQKLAAAGLQSLCCIPLITRNRVLGTLNVGSTKERAFTAADVDFLTQVAAQAAIAIENATAFQEIAQLKDRLAEENFTFRMKFAPSRILARSSATIRRSAACWNNWRLWRPPMRRS